jgi:hypothetical protein
MGNDGPDFPFVDNFETVHFASCSTLQFVEFDKNGRLILDYSKGASGYNPKFYSGWLREIYVDSLCRLAPDGTIELTDF